MNLRLLRVLCPLAVVACVSGCAAVSDISGAVAGLAPGAATANPAVAIGAGVAVKAATREGRRYFAREQRQAEQDAIAAAGGGLRVGQSQRWSVDRKGLRDTYGEVRVLRAVSTPLATCKELAFW